MFKVLSDHIGISALDLNITNSKHFYYASYSLLMTGWKFGEEELSYGV